MANGDITKETEYDKIEVVSTWHIQVRQATKIMEEQADGSKVELSRSFHRHVLSPFKSVYTPAVTAVEAVAEEKDSDGNVTKEAVEAVEAADAFWTHTTTDISGEDVSVQAIANAAWTDTVKNNYKAYRESQSS
tara:strand:+ start:138 stop:539 length:402 start_codon:yes stop_codon:yes gene_type:complete